MDLWLTRRPQGLGRAATGFPKSAAGVLASPFRAVLCRPDSTHGEYVSRPFVASAVAAGCSPTKVSAMTCPVHHAPAMRCTASVRPLATAGDARRDVQRRLTLAHARIPGRRRRLAARDGTEPAGGPSAAREDAARRALSMTTGDPDLLNPKEMIRTRLKMNKLCNKLEGRAARRMIAWDFVTRRPLCNKCFCL